MQLSNLSIAYESGFSNMQQYCVFLNPYGVHVRYPNELAIDEAMTKHAIENAQKLFDFCDSLINHGIARTTP